MKTSVVFASVLAAAGSAVADESAFRMLALSKGATFDGTYVRGTGGRFVLGKQTNSTCGSTAPSFTIANETLSTYGDGKQNVQMVSIDAGSAGGALAYKNYPYMLTMNDITEGFSTINSDGNENLQYNKKNWLACPETEKNVFSVFAEAAYAAKSDKQTCIPFTITAEKAEKPQVCQMS